MRYVLGVDAGGTKCQALLVCEDGVPAGWGYCDVSQPGSGRGVGGSGRSEATVGRAVRQALAKLPPGQELLAVGVGHMPPSWGVPADTRVTTRGVAEYDAVLELAGEPSGLVVLAGTGAFVYGRTPDGRRLHLDGLGPLLGDYGSAYDIGLRAVRAAARAAWHRRRRTALADTVPQACAALAGNPAGFGLVDYMLSNPDRGEIASLAVLVDRAAEAGDAVAVGIMEDAAAAIVETIRDVTDGLGVADADIAMVGTGGVATSSRLYWQRVCELTSRFAPRLRPVLPGLPAVVGVTLVGMREYVSDYESARQRLLGSVERGAKR